MTCFWKGIINLLDVGEMNKILDTHFNRKPPPKKFVKALKKKNIQVFTIKHNNIQLTQKETEDNYNSINEIKPTDIGNGYLCSGFEPVLFLISYLFGYTIKHIFNKIEIIYNNPNSKGELVFGSTTTHFYSIEKHI